METMPQIVRDRLEAMSLADLDIMAKTCGDAAYNKPIMAIRVEWISRVMTERIIDTFSTTTNDDEVIVSG